MTAVAMTYQRTGDTYSYHLAYMLEDVLVERRGEGKPFSSVILALSDALKLVPDGAVVLRRTDRPGLDEIKLDSQMRDLIRQDPDKYLAIVTEPDRVVVVGDRKAKRSAELYRSPHVRSGYDTLAESFGDHVYVRLRDDGKVECPCCGRWSATIEDIPVPYTRPDGSPLKIMVCACLAKLSVKSVSGSWVEIITMLLLTNAVYGRYYLPRSWNPAGWISRDELSRMYESYFKESEHV